MVSNERIEDALARLPDPYPDWIRKFRDRVRALLGERLRDLRLYGSAARGTMHDESDVDLLVLVDGVTPEDRDRIQALAYDINCMLHPWIADYERYHRPMNRATGFYEEVRKESIRL